MNLLDIIQESNAIDFERTTASSASRGLRKPNAISDADRVAWQTFTGLAKPGVSDLCHFVDTVEPGGKLREHHGMQCKVDSYMAPAGGPKIREMLESIMADAVKDGDPYDIHCRYEALHPFDRCNGHSGRALWAWMILRHPDRPQSFLRWWYAESLNRHRTV